MTFKSFALVLLTPLLLSAQPTAESLAALFDAFKKERAESKSAPEALQAADNLAKLAEDARKQESLLAASRLIRDARWSLPANPTNVPDGVRMIAAQRLRSGDRVNAVRYSADGTLLLTASKDRSVRVFDMANGREILAYLGHTPANTEEPAESGVRTPFRVADAAFHPDGKRVASAAGKQVHLWELATGKLLATLTGPTKIIKSIAFNGDGSKLAVGSDDLIVRVFATDTGKETFTSVAHTARIEQVAYQPNGKLVAAVDIDGFLCVYNPEGAKKTPLMKVQVTDGGTLPCYAVRFTPDGTKLLTGGADKIPRLTAATTTEGTTPPAGAVVKLVAHAEEVRAVDVTADGRFFVSGGKDKSVRVCDAGGTLIRQFTVAGDLTAMAVRPDGRQIAAACDDGSVKVWDLDTVDEHKPIVQTKDPIWTTAVSPDGATFATAGADKAIRLYRSNGVLKTQLAGSIAAVTSLAYLTNDKLLSAGGDKLVRVWDLAAGKESANWPGHAAAILALAVAPDGKLAVSGAADKSVIGWNPETGKKTWAWTARSVVAALAIHKSGAVIVGTSDGGITSLKIDGDKVSVAAFVNAHVSGVAALAFAADGGFFASVGGDGRLKAWKLDDKGVPTPIGNFNDAAAKATTGVVALSAVAISPDKKLLATGGADRVVRLWSASGEESRMLRGPTDWVTSVAFLSDTRLVSVGADSTARVFELPRAHEATAFGHSLRARAAVWSADGKEIISVGDDRLVHRWNAVTGVETGVIKGATDRLFTAGVVGKNLFATGGYDKFLRIWTLADGQVHTATPQGMVFGVFPGADGKRVGVWSQTNDRENSYEIFDTSSVPPPETPGGASRLKLVSGIVEKERAVKAATLSCDLALAASGDDSGGVQVWTTATGVKAGAVLKPFQEPGALPEALGGLVGGAAPAKNADAAAIADLGFSADAKSIAVINTKGEIRVVAVDGKLLAKADGPAGGVNGLVTAAKVDRFAVFGTERTVQVFDFAGKELKVWTLPAAMQGGTFSADGMQLLTANADGSLCVLDVP